MARLRLSGRQKKTSSADISQPEGARFAAAGRANEVYFSASYLWFKKLRTVVEAKFVNMREEELNFGLPNFDIEGLFVRKHRRGV